MNVSKISMIIRVGFGPDWSLAQEVQDIAEKVGVGFVGGSAESGQAFYRATGMKIGEFRQACANAGFVATIQGPAESISNP